MHFDAQSDEPKSYPECAVARQDSDPALPPLVALVTGLGPGNDAAGRRDDGDIEHADSCAVHVVPERQRARLLGRVVPWRKDACRVTLAAWR